MGQTPFRIIVPTYRAERWIERCIGSIRSQQGADLRAIVLDDQSPDGTLERARTAAAGDERIVVERSPERRYPLGNTVHGIREISTDPEDVIVILDGDDWLAHDRVLERLDRVYADGEAWVTYGSHCQWKDKWTYRWGLRRRRGEAQAYPDALVRARAFRQGPGMVLHLKSFKRFLFDAVRDEDLRDDEGNYFPSCGDVAYMYPMMEMAGEAHLRFVDDVLYVYNLGNPLNEHRTVAGEQILNCCRIRLKPSYPLLEREGA